MTPHWRSAVPADAPAIAALARAELGDYGEAAALYAERIALAPEGCRVFVDGPTVIGHCISHPWRRSAPPAMHAMLGAIPADADCWYLHDVVFAREGRGMKAVERLLPDLCATARGHGIATLALIAVGGADRYWTRLGFTAAPGGADGFGASALYMERPA